MLCQPIRGTRVRPYRISTLVNPYTFFLLFSLDLLVPDRQRPIHLNELACHFTTSFNRPLNPLALSSPSQYLPTISSITVLSIAALVVIY